MDELMEFAGLIASRLETAGIPYMLTGSMAMAIYAVPRMTRDIDIVIECGPEDARRIHSLFAPDCYVDEESIREAAVHRGVFNIIHNTWLLKADFVVRRDEVYRRVEFERRRRFDVEGKGISVATPEDLILSKLIWAKDADSDLQRNDAHAIAESVRDLDWSYLEKWAAGLNVANLLEKLRNA